MGLHDIPESGCQKPVRKHPAEQVERRGCGANRRGSDGGHRGCSRLPTRAASRVREAGAGGAAPREPGEGGPADHRGSRCAAGPGLEGKVVREKQVREALRDISKRRLEAAPSVGHRGSPASTVLRDRRSLAAQTVILGKRMMALDTLRSGPWWRRPSGLASCQPCSGHFPSRRPLAA